MNQELSQSDSGDPVDVTQVEPLDGGVMSNESAVVDGGKDTLPVWAPFALITVIWLPALIRFSAEWSFNPQYYYGWAVPLLAAYLIYERIGLNPQRDLPRFKWFAILVIIACALPQLPLRLLGEANSTARLISLAMGMSAMGISLALLYLYGGKSWLKMFAGPVLFLAVSIPWPGQIEQPTIQGLMRINAQISADVVSFAGVPAEARGNVIEVPTGLLGVDEACSGIRSLQSTLMAAAFLGLLYRCGTGGFIVLVLLGAAIAFVCNVIRTTFLTWQGAVNGIQAVDEWHDSAGFIILGVVMVCLWLISQFLDRQAAREVPAA